jgi:hypothetical protein
MESRDLSNFGKVGTVALYKGEIRIMQLSVMGSVLCYSLLVGAYTNTLVTVVDVAEIARFWDRALSSMAYISATGISAHSPQKPSLHSTSPHCALS